MGNRLVGSFCPGARHAHLLFVPADAAGLWPALGEAHRRYTLAVNRREGWTGHLRQRRFTFCALDPSHLLAAVRYIELNPVRARLVATPEAWPWSSVKARLTGQDDGLTAREPLTGAVGDWRGFLEGGLKERDADDLRRHERSGRPLGDTDFVSEMEARLGRRLRSGKRGPPKQAPAPHAELVD